MEKNKVQSEFILKNG